MYVRNALAGLPTPNRFAGGFMRIAPSLQQRIPRLYRRYKYRRRMLSFDANAAANSSVLKPMQLAGLGRMTPEQEAAKKQLKQDWKARRKAILAQYKGQGKKAKKAALIAAMASKKDWRQIAKAVKQAAKAGLPGGDPLAPSTPSAPGGVIVDVWNPPMSTGSGGGGGGAPMDYGDGGSAEPANGNSILPLALTAAGLYFLT